MALVEDIPELQFYFINGMISFETIEESIVNHNRRLNPDLSSDKYLRKQRTQNNMWLCHGMSKGYADMMSNIYVLTARAMF